LAWRGRSTLVGGSVDVPYFCNACVLSSISVRLNASVHENLTFGAFDLLARSLPAAAGKKLGIDTRFLIHAFSRQAGVQVLPFCLLNLSHS
jgi:hypothetical protein